VEGGGAPCGRPSSPRVNVRVLKEERGPLRASVLQWRVLNFKGMAHYSLIVAKSCTQGATMLEFSFGTLRNKSKYVLPDQSKAAGREES